SSSGVQKKLNVDRISKTSPLVKLAFDLDYIGGETNHSLEHFIIHVFTVYEAWKSLRNRYYSPYFAFFQSSGSGKSKLFNSLTDSYWVSYVSFATEKAYPQTPVLKQSLLSREGKELDLSYYFSYFCAVLQSWNQAQKRNAKGHQSWSKKWFNDEKVIDETIIEKHMSQVAEFGKEKEFEKYARELLDKMIDETRFPLIIVFDEARAMVATGDFESVRRALRYFTKGVVAVFADTMSSLCNFSPSPEADPSFRPRTYMELFPPFYQLCTFDLFARQKNYRDCEIWEYGRVMWAAFKSCGMTEGDLVAFAQSKLLGGHERVETPITMTTQVAIAILSSFASIEITPSSSLSKQVVAGNMAMCLHVSHDRSSIIARYPSDPVLAEAAAKLVQDTFNHEKRMQMLRFLANSLTNGLVERGKRGELIGSLIIGLAMQKCQKASFQKMMPFRYSQAVSLQAFLNVFIDIDEESLDTRLENVYAKFSHAWKISGGTSQQLSKALLKTGWDRGCYFLCEENQEAVDVVIPTSRNANSYDDGPPLLIQIKNRSGRGAIRDAFLKLGSAKLDAIKPESDN
ncbi:8963_t:CDS:2, partial [Paraglomus brasilianum]